MRKYKSAIILFAWLAICATAISSCSIVRGLTTDGKNGPDIFSFEKREVDTIANGGYIFQFPVGKRADWIDTTFSISKSITSLMCGIAIDDGYIRSIDDPVTDYLPELKKKDPMWQKLTIRHLLDMRSGLDFDDTYDLNWKELRYLNAMAKLNYGHNIQKQIQGLKFRCEPGTRFRYESMTAAILGVVIERASGKRFAVYHGYHFNWYNINYEDYIRPEYSGYYALGICEQVLYVNPYKNLIMVRIGLHNHGYTRIPVLFEQMSGPWPVTEDYSTLCP